MNPILYTWMDVETFLQTDENMSRWPESWKAIEVYSTELIIYTDGTEPSQASSKTFLREVFNSAYNRDLDKINLLHRDIDVTYETADEDDNTWQQKQSPLPLFSRAKASLGDSSFQADELPVPIVAFHSYKGGVGRTLSAIALVRELSNDKSHPLKTLIVDADIEAPGLSWLASEAAYKVSPTISYLDILTILHDCPAQGSDAKTIMEKAVSGVAKVISLSTMQIPADEFTTEHYFVHAYREESQLFGRFPNPSDIVSMPNRAFAITDFLSQVAKELGADVIVIDLRAGFTELSAPFLFDPRVRRVLVTSTSYQSTRGTKLLLEKIINSPFYPKERDDYLSPTLLLSMVPATFKQNQIADIKDDLLSVFPQTYKHGESDDDRLSDTVIEAMFAESLIHLENIAQICDIIKNIGYKNSISLLRARILPKESIQKISKESQMAVALDRIEMLEKIHKFAKTAITAEGSASVHDMLITTSLKNLVGAINNGLPRLVIIGPKGSGKTYLYKQLLNNKYLDAFAASIRSEEPKNNVVIAPLLATKNRSVFQNMLTDTYNELAKVLGHSLPTDILSDVETYIENAEVITVADWIKLALKWYCPQESGTMEALNELMQKQGKKLVFLVDGIDDIFNDIIETEKSKTAIRSLCQDFVNRIASYPNIGIIIFARNDMLEGAISTNYEQFRNPYERYALRWQHKEALQLVVWILSRVGFSDWKDMELEIGSTLYEKAVELLQSFWGIKLGSDKSNEANTARWILAALSDFNGLVQARDIIRFLEYAAETPIQIAKYDDRYLMPADIRKAINPCSKKKYDEIKTEMKRLFAVLEALDNVPESEKVLPLSAERIPHDHRKILESHGYLKEHQGSYYLPEIIRHALGYRYTKGRAKVLSLLLTK